MKQSKTKKTSNGISKVKIQNSFLFNRDEEGKKRYKLILTQSDKNTLISILEDTELPENYSRNIVDNYQFFKEQIAKTNIDLESLYIGFLKLMIVDIVLESRFDNPQLIFESLNSTGLELSQADLIRNYVLIGLPRQKQNEIYTKYWYKIEKSFRDGDSSIKYFDQFMKDYLTIKTHSIPKEREIYSVFKRFYTNEITQNKTSEEELVQDIYHYSKFFTILAFEKTDDDEILQKIKDINSLRVNVSYPFLLRVYFDFDKGVISREQLLVILDLVGKLCV